MRFATLFNVALVAFFAVPTALAQPVHAEAIYSRELAHGTAIEARRLEYLINDMIQKRTLAGEDRAVLEARFLPFVGLKVLGKGFRVLKDIVDKN